MKKLYSYTLNYGRMGVVSGLFVADEAHVLRSLDKQVYFGEVLGKHSEVYAPLRQTDLVIKSDDQEFITKLVSIIGGDTISGHNPLEYIEDDGSQDEGGE